MTGLQVAPDQIERPGARFSLAQGRPGRLRIFHGQPSACAARGQQWSSRQFGGKPVAGKGLQVIVRVDAFQQNSEGNDSISHSAIVGNVLIDSQGLSLGQCEQFSRAPGAAGGTCVHLQFCGLQGCAEQQQGTCQNETPSLANTDVDNRLLEALS